MDQRTPSLLVVLAAAALASGCREKSTADLTKDVQHANGEVVDAQQDVHKAAERLAKAREAYDEDVKKLDRAQRHATDAQSDLARRARQDSAATRSAAPPPE